MLKHDPDCLCFACWAPKRNREGDSHLHAAPWPPEGCLQRTAGDGFFYSAQSGRAMEQALHARQEYLRSTPDGEVV